jgi:hypothetical protein
MAPAEVLKKDFAKEVIRCFRLESPLVDAMNTPLVTSVEKSGGRCLASN